MHYHATKLTFGVFTLKVTTIKRIRLQARVVFISPCAAKKLEASRASVRSDVDFVITFEELAEIFAAKDLYEIDLP